jgi:ribose/xylose/arabinose/galactoside ABC-type transport system permease subunit
LDPGSRGLGYWSGCCGALEAILQEHPVYFHSNNPLSILLQCAIGAIIAIGMTFIIMPGSIDIARCASLNSGMPACPDVRPAL